MPVHAMPVYPCFPRERLDAALSDTPVVLLLGPRQCGKTTLARRVCEPLGYGLRLAGISAEDPLYGHSAFLLVCVQ